MNSQNLAACFCAFLQNPSKYLFLQIEGAEVAGTGVQSDFADVARLGQVLFPQGNFR